MKKLLTLFLIVFGALVFAQVSEIKVNAAVQKLMENPKSHTARIGLSNLIEGTDFDNEINNYLLAKSYLEDGPNHVVESFINKAISFNHSNLDYRWIRVRCNMMSNSTEKDFNQAVEDLNFMINNGAATGKVYQYLGTAYQQLGIEYSKKYETPENSYKDENSIDAKTIENHQKTVTFFNKSIEAFKLAIEKKPELSEDLKYDIQDSEKYLSKFVQN